ncbi:MAG: TonB-dependent receptor [Acidobacteria bacterium]|nr:TonB-dependent receptor [Acidobacteriota bacterium]
MTGKKLISSLILLAFLLSHAPRLWAEETGGGTLRGKVILSDNATPVHSATVTITQLHRVTQTDDQGNYEFQNVPPGTYDVVAHLDRVPDVIKQIQMKGDSLATLDFQLQLTGVKEQITVTASGGEESSFNSLQSVTSLNSIELAQKNTASLGEALDHELGVAKRSSGPGTARPVLRGFDGDRVLVLQDGVQTGSIGSQSGDHGEPIDVLSLEKLEVVKGPATLLYGSNAIGGVVNAISGHDSPHQGIHGYLTGILGSNRANAGGSGGLEFGTDKWLFWGNGGAQRSDDYRAANGIVKNSFTRSTQGSIGAGYYLPKTFFSANYSYNHNRYGIPYDTREADPEIVNLQMRKHSIQFNGGFRDVDAFVNAGKFYLKYNDYQHKEIDTLTGATNTTFNNKTFLYNAMFDERKVGKLSGTLGFSGLHRNYESLGVESIAPPTKQNAFAVFGLEKVDFERLSFQFGGRIERNAYTPVGLLDRTFTGFSGGAGMRVQTWKGGAVVVNFTHNYRAPALEELYNHGPHPGNQAFEIGNPNLQRESGDGLEFGVRHSTNRVHGEFNLFYYHIRDFVYLAPTGGIDSGSGLRIADYNQGTSRFAGTEAQLSVALHTNLWLNTEMDYVNAELTQTHTPLPRIPPLRGRVGLEYRYKGLTLTPEAVMAKDQNRLFPTETRTAGYTTFDLNGSYTLASQHFAQIFSVNGFNLGNRLYFNHLSFIKDFAPEIGRGVRFTYTMRFF